MAFRTSSSSGSQPRRISTATSARCSRSSIRALLLVVGLLFALQAVGIDLTLLTVFGGALGVGIGLGLQKLASNYIAGFTILLDRSIRLGDMITVDNRHGVVTAVTSRYVVVRSLDGVEAIVPNETLVTTTVLNHSYTSKDVRIGIPVQVSYDSDVDLALRLHGGERARAEPRVLKTPKPPLRSSCASPTAASTSSWACGSAIRRKASSTSRARSTARSGGPSRPTASRFPIPQREMRILNPTAAAESPATGQPPPGASPG